jgi:hypothetical protein
VIKVKLSPDGNTITLFILLWRCAGRNTMARPGCDDWAPPPKIDGVLLKA